MIHVENVRGLFKICTVNLNFLLWNCHELFRNQHDTNLKSAHLTCLSVAVLILRHPRLMCIVRLQHQFNSTLHTVCGIAWEDWYKVHTEYAGGRAAGAWL